MVITYKTDGDIITRITTIEEIFDLREIDLKIKKAEDRIEELEKEKIKLDEYSKDVEPAIIIHNKLKDDEINLLEGETVLDKTLLREINILDEDLSKELSKV